MNEIQIVTLTFYGLWVLAAAPIPLERLLIYRFDVPQPRPAEQRFSLSSI